MKAIDQTQDPAVDAINRRLKSIHSQGRAGFHKVGVTFLQHTLAQSEDRLPSSVPGGVQDRVLRVSSFEIRGPFNPTGLTDTASRRRIFSCQPKAPAEEEECARAMLARLGAQAHRRPLTDEDLKALVGFYRKGRETGDFDAGVRMGLTAILASPDFLYQAGVPAQPLAARMPRARGTCVRTSARSLRCSFRASSARTTAWWTCSRRTTPS